MGREERGKGRKGEKVGLSLCGECKGKRGEREERGKGKKGKGEGKGSLWCPNH